DGPGAAESTSAIHAQCIELAARAPERVKRDVGNVDTAFAAAARTIEAVYEQPLVAHAQMEPMNCTAHWRGDRCAVWAPTQDPAGARDAVRAVTGLPASGITVHMLRMGGAFGRRFYHDGV